MKSTPTSINLLAKSTLLCAVLCFRVGTLWGQALEQVLTSFGFPDAANPLAGLIQGTDGALYGTTSLGGSNGYGVVFKISTNSTDFTSIYSFTGVSEDGANPCAGLVQARDGALYGTTRYGGSNGNGMIFRLSTDGSNYTPLYSFPAVFGSGGDCQAGLVQGTDGFLYGTGSLGGTYGFGIVFKLNTNGTGYTTLHNFSAFYSPGDGARPYTGLVQGRDGALYGTTLNGGTNGYGMIFKVSTDGTVYSPLYSFVGPYQDGENPLGGIIQGDDGALYGTTSGGGAYGYGTVFKLSTNGTGYHILYSFTPNGRDGQDPRAALVQGRDGDLYGTTVEGGNLDKGTVFKLSTSGIGYTELHIFSSTGGDGLSPYGLVQGGDGAFYGTTYAGGTSNNGTVYRLLVPPFILRVGSLPDRNVWLSTLAVPNLTLQFIASTNLTNWAVLTNITGNVGTVQFNDLAATNYAARFYGAVWNH
jgi:uncharacterized repeat protein (TIGR03803 family)